MRIFGLGRLHYNLDRGLVAQRYAAFPCVVARNIAGMAPGEIILPEMMPPPFLPGKPKLGRTAAGFQLAELFCELAGHPQKTPLRLVAELLSSDGGDGFDPDEGHLEVSKLRRHGRLAFLFTWCYFASTAFITFTSLRRRATALR